MIEKAKQESVPAILARLDERTSCIYTKVDKIDKTLHENGLILEVDRNTTWRKRITWSIPVLIALVALLYKILQ